MIISVEGKIANSELIFAPIYLKKKKKCHITWNSKFHTRCARFLKIIITSFLRDSSNSLGVIKILRKVVSLGHNFQVRNDIL